MVTCYFCASLARNLLIAFLIKRSFFVGISSAAPNKVQNSGSSFISLVGGFEHVVLSPSVTSNAIIIRGEPARRREEWRVVLLSVCFSRTF
ncbi:unnamed protein product [Linum trigynum]|uniref:Secreted protein n=1 Tax=Linum trigynum TaxID=586398 RepID=A0AAV2E937_9ROSI